MIEVRLPIRTVNGLNERTHWTVRSRRAKAERSAVGWAMSCTEACAVPCVVTLTREGKRDMDGDGLQASFKHCRDAVADWLKVNDADPRVQWVYQQARAKLYAVLIQVRPL